MRRSPKNDSNKPQPVSPSLDKPSTVRLNKWIAQCTGMARRKADDLITAGKVVVNGKLATLGQNIQPGKDKISMHGQPLVAQTQSKLYVMMYKPKGVMTTKLDPQGRKTVYDYLPDFWHQVDPVGRLDKDSTGLLLLSNDGDFVHQLSHPSFHHAKKYRVKVNRTLTKKVVEQLETGIQLQPENQVAKCTVEDWVNPFTLVLVLKTGMNRQIRRMFEAFDYEVTQLKRIAIDQLVLGPLRPGQTRLLKPSDLRKLGLKVDKT